MKLKSFIIASAAVIFGTSSMNAQTAKEVQATVSKMESKSALCNKGPEAFNSFIAKFSTDEEFMKSRIKLAEEMGMSADFMKTVLQAIHEESVKQQVEVINGRKI